MKDNRIIILAIALLFFLASSGCSLGTKASASELGNSSDPSGSELSPTPYSSDKVRPPLNEEDILNMTDEDLIRYGMLEIDGLVEDVRVPNNKREEFGLGKEYEQIFRRADRSASDYDEALAIIEETWEDRDKSSHKNIRLAGENDEIWLFACDYYYDGEFSFIFTTSVYKKDYYDEEKGIAYFDLNEENILHFFACRTVDADEDSKTCFGQFVIRDGDGYIFRQYDLWICYGDWGISDEVNLTGTEYKISENGKIEISDLDKFHRKLYLPSQKLTDEYEGF